MGQVENGPSKLFHGPSSTNFTWSILEYLAHILLTNTGLVHAWFSSQITSWWSKMLKERLVKCKI